jgi:hypothetical protein
MAEPNDDDGGHGDDGGENGDDVADDSEHDNDGANELAKMAMLAANIPTTGMMKRVKLADRRTCGIDAPLKLTCVSVSRFLSCFTFLFHFARFFFVSFSSSDFAPQTPLAKAWKRSCLALSPLGLHRSSWNFSQRWVLPFALPSVIPFARRPYFPFSFRAPSVLSPFACRPHFPFVRTFLFPFARPPHFPFSFRAPSALSFFLSRTVGTFSFRVPSVLSFFLSRAVRIFLFPFVISSVISSVLPSVISSVLPSVISSFLPLLPQFLTKGPVPLRKRKRTSFRDDDDFENSLRFDDDFAFNDGDDCQLDNDIHVENDLDALTDGEGLCASQSEGQESTTTTAQILDSLVNDHESTKTAKALAAKVKKASYDKSIRERRQENRRKKLRGEQAAPVSDAEKRRIRIEKKRISDAIRAPLRNERRRKKKEEKARESGDSNY